MDRVPRPQNPKQMDTETRRKQLRPLRDPLRPHNNIQLEPERPSGRLQTQSQTRLQNRSNHTM